MAERILLGTRKGLLTLQRGAAGWAIADVAFPGVAVEYAMADPRTGVTWAALSHGHWGPKLHRRAPGGDWEAIPTPTFGADRDIAVANLWVVAPGHNDEPDVLYIGTNPGALFRSEDGGDSFQLVDGLWDHETRGQWFGGGRDTPGIHSVMTDPRDAGRILVGISCGGVFESVDNGASWAPRNRGMLAPFLPDPEPEVGQDPHFIHACASDPDTIWQQNHSGVYVSRDGASTWQEVSQDDGPVGFGFPIAAHPQRPDVAWVVPAAGDENRSAIDGRLFLCRTEDGGASWTELTRGLPQQGAWDLVYRHALDIAGSEQLAFGSTTGNAYLSDDGGEGWTCLGTNLPPIYSVRFA